MTKRASFRATLVASLLPLLVASGTPTCAAGPEPGTRGVYRVLPGEHRGSQPLDVVELTYGPRSISPRGESWWWELTLRRRVDSKLPILTLRAETARDPEDGSSSPLGFRRYRLREGDASPALDYRDVHTKRAALPSWPGFEALFVPHPAPATRRRDGLPNSCEYLGHVLTLVRVDRGIAWKEWSDVLSLELDPELLIGTGRTVRDSEGHRLPQKPERRNYDYVPFSADDYRTMVDAGMTQFGVVPGMESWLRSQPVYHRTLPDPTTYPLDLYRSNFTGPVMFMDEPTCIMVGDKTVHTTLRHFTDASVLITKRVRSLYHPRALGMAQHLRGAGISLGDMELLQDDFPTWETRYETAFYQLAGGGSGFVHEGRYQLGEFNEWAKATTGHDREYTAEEMLRYIYAHMRGAARHFGKHWGTSIYGQADPAITPLAITLAYDMGARWIWYWTSDHDHHLPWPEQLELTRHLRKHVDLHPRRSIRATPPVLDKAIVIPRGYFLVLESPTGRRNAWDLWWVREMDAAGQNEASRAYRALMRDALAEVNAALDAGEEFDFVVDDGRPISRYRRVVRLRDP